MSSSRLLITAMQHSARLSTGVLILLFLPLTLSTLSTSAFLTLSLILTSHSIIHSTLNFIFPGIQGVMPFLQVPLHPVLLLLVFNLYSHPGGILLKLASYWGTFLRFCAPVALGLEGLSTLMCIQSLGRKAKSIAERSDAEGLQFGMLIGAAATYVASVWWIIVAYPSAATSPLSSTLLGVCITALVFLTIIGFALRRTNVIEASGMCAYLAYNVWLCSDRSEADTEWLDFSSSPYAPLLSNLLPHLESLLRFITHTLPKPLLIGTTQFASRNCISSDIFLYNVTALLYRLWILHMASRILPSIAADSWENEAGVDGAWEGRPSSRLTTYLLAYRQTIFLLVYSHLLLLDHASFATQVWWRWALLIFTLALWAVEIALGGDEGELAEKWKVE